MMYHYCHQVKNSADVTVKGWNSKGKKLKDKSDT